MARIAAAVATVMLWLESLDPFRGRQPPCRRQIVHQLVAVGINVRVDVMGRHRCGVAEPDLRIEGRCPEPERTATYLLRGFPESDVVTAACTLANLLLERQVLFSLPQVEIVDGGRFVRTMQQDAP